METFNNDSTIKLAENGKGIIKKKKKESSMLHLHVYKMSNILGLPLPSWLKLKQRCQGYI